MAAIAGVFDAISVVCVARVDSSPVSVTVNAEIAPEFEEMFVQPKIRILSPIM